MVNDGSSDETGTLVQEAADNGPVTLLTHSVNQGLGRAMHTGIEYVCNTWSGDDILVTMDADNTHDPELIHEMYKELKKAYEILDGFDHKVFLDGAKKAFEIIISAYNQGEKKTLKGLVSKDVFTAFEKAINNKNNNPSSQFYSLVIDGVEDAKLENNIVKITLRFTSEQFTNDDENTVIKKQDVWTFEKKVDSKSPEWILTST